MENFNKELYVDYADRAYGPQRLKFFLDSTGCYIIEVHFYIQRVQLNGIALRNCFKKLF